MELEGPRMLTSFWPRIILFTPVVTNGKKMDNCNLCHPQLWQTNKLVFYIVTKKKIKILFCYIVFYAHCLCNGQYLSKRKLENKIFTFVGKFAISIAYKLAFFISPCSLSLNQLVCEFIQLPFDKFLLFQRYLPLPLSQFTSIAIFK